MAEKSRRVHRLEESDSGCVRFGEPKEKRERRDKHGIEPAKKLNVLYGERVEDKEDIEPLEDSRLHLLNDDCLCLIFDQLSIVDLSRISQLDKYFQVLIQQRVIGKKLININFLFNVPEWFSNRILIQFGQHFRKITCQAAFTYKGPVTPFERFLVMITKHCSPNTFTEVEMKFRYAYLENPDIGRLSIPYFTKVEKLVLCDFTIHENNAEFFKALANNLTNLKVLTLDNVCVSDLGLQFNFDLSVFLKSKPKLRTFSYRGNQEISPLIVDALKQGCTDLKTYIDLSYHHPRFNSIQNKKKDRYNYLCEIVNLKSVTMISYTPSASDLCYPLQKLAAKNQLESLRVYVHIDNALDNECFLNAQQTFGHFTSLRNIDIITESVMGKTYDLKTNFLLQFMSACRFLSRVRITGSRIYNINQILESVPNIRILCLEQATMKCLPFEMKKIVQSAMKVRKRQMELGEDKPLLHLNLNLEQWREVQVYKYIDTILTSDIIHRENYLSI